MTRNDYKIDNSGNNQGLIVAENKGSIQVSIKKIERIPSCVSIIVKSLGEVCLNDDIEKIFNLKKLQLKEFKPDEKIEYNCVVKYKDIIRCFSSYHPVCERYLNAYDDSNMRGKSKILNYVYLNYLEAKGIVLLENKDSDKKDIDIIRQNSDRLIDMVQNDILEIVKANNEIDVMYIEDIKLGVTCFICYCFMECKILEKPL